MANDDDDDTSSTSLFLFTLVKLLQKRNSVPSEISLLLSLLQQLCNFSVLFARHKKFTKKIEPKPKRVVRRCPRCERSSRCSIPVLSFKFFVFVSEISSSSPSWLCLCHSEDNQNSKLNQILPKKSWKKCWSAKVREQRKLKLLQGWFKRVTRMKRLQMSFLPP